MLCQDFFCLKNICVCVCVLCGACVCVRACVQCVRNNPKNCPHGINLTGIAILVGTIGPA